MELLRARPKRIIGNIALASAWTLPVGIAFGLLLAMLEGTLQTPWAILKNAAIGACMVSATCFLCGMIFIAPTLFVLRRFDLGGPFVVYGLCFLIGCSFFQLSLQGGFFVLAIATAASWLFCRYAYEP